MEKNKRQLIILGAVSLIFIVMILMSFGKHKPRAGKTPTATAKVASHKIEAAKERPASTFRNWGRDPFAIGSSTVVASGDLVLTGIVWDAKKPYCFLNGKVLGIGDVILGYKIVEIKKDSVAVKAGDQTRLLKVWRQ